MQRRQQRPVLQLRKVELFSASAILIGRFNLF